jgi:hypothetical protein
VSDTLLEIDARRRIDLRPDEHYRAEQVWLTDLRAHRNLPDRDSRLCELVEFFGFEIAQKAPYATAWFYDDDPRKRRYIEKQLGLDPTTSRSCIMYAFFNMDPERPDLFSTTA